MKVSVSLPPDDVEFLDEYAKSEGYASRSAVVQKAIEALRLSGLGAAYEDAWRDWADSGDAEVWESTASDGLDP